MVEILGLNLNSGLIPFLITAGIFVWYGFSIIYHLIRFGVGRNPKIIALVFFAGSFIFFNTAYNAYKLINWAEIAKHVKTLLLPL
jgi:hypothetical protein